MASASMRLCAGVRAAREIGPARAPARARSSAAAPARRAPRRQRAAELLARVPSRPAETRRPCSRNLAPYDDYSILAEMQSAHELLTRWPALDVAAKRARLERLAAPVARPADASPASTRRRRSRRRAACGARSVGMERRPGRRRRRSPNRLGWMSSPALMADSIDRLQAFAASVKRDGFTDVVLLGMGGSSLAPEVLRAVIGVAPGWPRLHMLDSTDPAAVRAAATPPRSHAVSARQQVGHDHRAELARRALPRSARRTPASPRWADHFVAITDEGTALDAARARRTLPRPVHQPVRHRRPLLRAVVLRHGAGRADGPGHRRDRRLGARDARRRRTAAPTPRSTNPAVGARAGAWAPRAHDGRDKLTLLAAAGARRVRPVGRTADRREHRQARHRHRADRRRAARPIRDVYGNDRLFVRLRVHGAPARTRATPACARSNATDAPIVDDRPARAAGARRRVRAMGDRHRRRRRAARDQSVRSAERAAGQRRDATRCSTEFKTNGRLPIRRPIARSTASR